MASEKFRILKILILVLNPIRHFRAIIAAVFLVAERFEMAFLMAKRDLNTRYAGQILGFFWNIVHPMFLMLLFLFIFGVIFKQRIGGSHELPRDYTVYILSGIVPWLSIVPVFSGASMAVISNAALVKQFDFEPEILPIKEVILSLVFWITGITIVTVYQLFIYQTLPWTYVLLPVVFVIHIGTMIGIGWLLAAVSVFVRDIKDIVQLITVAGMYILPVIYLPSWVPSAFKPIMYMNPFSYLIWCYQDVLYFGRIEHPEAWGVSVFFMFLVLSVGHRIFQRLKPFFGNVL